MQYLLQQKVAIITIFFVLVIFVCPARAQDTGSVDAFQKSKEWNKLDARTQQAWLDAMKSGDTTRRLDCFVRVRAPADRGDESFLFSHGFDVRMFAGTVASGHMKAEDLPSVAGLPFVDSIRLSTKN